MTVPATSPATSVRRLVAFVFYNIAAVLVLLLLVEGIASIAYTVRDAFAAKPLARAFHTEYDRDLGWVNRPSVYLSNMYGPGKYLRTNSQRFRNNTDFTKSVPPGKTRIICSGDSFTLGYGVDNDHTWPQLLASRAADIETVNMGQGGYGADQAYLWYKRDGVKLDHDIQIFAFIADDLRRMQSPTSFGYGKPMLVVENGQLVTKNVPVPLLVQVWSPNLARAQAALLNLSTMRLLRSVFRLDPSAAATQTRKESNQETSLVLSHMLDDLVATNRAKNSFLVLAYLPTRDEGESGAYWRKFLAEYAHQHGLLYLDLTDDFRRLPPQQLDQFFIASGALDFTGAAGHYTEAGNAFSADLIYRGLLANPEIAAKLRSRSASDAATFRPAMPVRANSPEAGKPVD